VVSSSVKGKQLWYSWRLSRLAFLQCGQTEKDAVLDPHVSGSHQLLGQDFVVNFATCMRVYTVGLCIWFYSFCSGICIVWRRVPITNTHTVVNTVAAEFQCIVLALSVIVLGRPDIMNTDQNIENRLSSVWEGLRSIVTVFSAFSFYTAWAAVSWVFVNLFPTLLSLATCIAVYGYLALCLTLYRPVLSKFCNSQEIGCKEFLQNDL